MARASGRGSKKAVKKKSKVKVSPKRQAGTAPFVDTSSLDAANELVTRRPRSRSVAMSAQTVMPPILPGDTPSPQQQPASAALAGESSLTANATVTATEAADTLAATGTVAWPPEYERVLARLTALEASAAEG
jgi:hypothetical protein